MNPRLFARPASTRHWASHAVLGERVWLARKSIPVPAHHRSAPHVLAAVAGVGSVIAIWGVVELAIWPTLLGATLIYSGKLWFLDRMAWRYRDAMTLSDEYRSWDY